MHFQQNINICISFDQKLVAEGIIAILSRHKGIVFKNLFSNKYHKYHDEIRLCKPDVLIVEAEYVTLNLVKLLGKTRQSFPQLKILMISGMVIHDLLNDLLLSIDGYMLRTCESEKLILALHEISESRKYLCPQLINTLLIKKELPEQNNRQLSPREREILLLWFQIEDMMKIANTLNISRTTVRSHLKNIRDKLGKPSLAQLIFYACQESQLNGNTIIDCPYCKSGCNLLTQQNINTSD